MTNQALTFTLTLALLAATAGTSLAQRISGGFKVGANFSSLNGPVEEDAAGEALGSFGMLGGFHVGGIFNVGITDIFGLRGELLYSQKGGRADFEGTSYWVFIPNNGDNVYHIGGNRRQRAAVVNSYLDIPLMAYIRLGKLELSGGANVAVLVGSRLAGEVDYSALNVDPFRVVLEYSYLRNKPGDNPVVQSQNVRVGGQTLEAPSITEAYYPAFGQTRRPYNFFDVGLLGGASFFLNKGLFIGLRANLGLLDVTRNDQDIALHKLADDNSFISLDRTNRNFSAQVSLGFSF